MNSSNLEMID
ncbi:Protein of unknown function [Bacillus cereus]|nr:Protein of unknown function [Bacillus cereus]